jgi:hypothetical protein
MCSDNRQEGVIRCQTMARKRGHSWESNNGLYCCIPSKRAPHHFLLRSNGGSVISTLFVARPRRLMCSRVHRFCEPCFCEQVCLAMCGYCMDGARWFRVVVLPNWPTDRERGSFRSCMRVNRNMVVAWYASGRVRRHRPSIIYDVASSRIIILMSRKHMT